ncbi:MAG TPA: DUF948 domain-containing protein [Gemmatimonadota bacterium]|nr:DUF948 domain-containing protein [Gemmatimonadota bacterium]
MEYALWNTIALCIIAAFFLILTLVLLFVGIPVALDLKRSVRHLRGTVDEVRVKLDPILFRAQAMADDVQEMTATAKREVARVGSSVDRVSERIDDLAALVEVVQEEIRRPLLKSVATLSGAKRFLSRYL